MKIKINAIAIAKNDEVKENSNYISLCCDETFFLPSEIEYFSLAFHLHN